jgi:hypothetical protein
LSILNPPAQIFIPLGLAFHPKEIQHTSAHRNHIALPLSVQTRFLQFHEDIEMALQIRPADIGPIFEEYDMRYQRSRGGGYVAHYEGL